MKAATIRTLKQAKRWLFFDLPAATRQNRKGAAGLERGRYLMKLLDNPQDSYQTVHIAGTSGKGSTAYMIAGLLQAVGKVAGLHVSPHVYDFRERMQVDKHLITVEELCRHLNHIRAISEDMARTEFGSPTYFEVALALAHLVFREHQVDYGVVETGLGGLYDVSNLVTRTDKLSVITQIGLDHTDILGNTIGEIAAQKAGIILPKSHAIALWQSAEARASFDKRTRAAKAELEYVDPGNLIHIRSEGIQGTNFDLKLDTWDWPGLNLSAVGKHQMANVVLALRAVQYLGGRDGWSLTKEQAVSALQRLRLPGRFEVYRVAGKQLILDSANNPQKLAALTRTLRQLFPGQKITFILAMSRPRNAAELLEPLVPLADKIILGRFNTGTIHKLYPPIRLARQLKTLRFTSYEFAPGPRDALSIALKSSPNIIVATGSLYFLAQIRYARPANEPLTQLAL